MTRLLERVVPQVAQNLATLPQRAGESAATYARTGEYDPAPVVEAAMMAMGIPGRPTGAQVAPRSMETKIRPLYNPPVKPARPFSADYPHGALADETGRLLADIEGRPLTAGYVVGRRVVGGHDEAFSPAQLNPLTEALIGRGPSAVPPGQMGPNLGYTLVKAGKPIRIGIRDDLKPYEAAKVLAHENGHAIDLIAGDISTRGLSNELKGIYNTLNNSTRTRDGLDAASGGKTFRPEDLGYKGAEVSREYMVEAIRAYMADPNYLKTVAPKTAAAIRAAVNENPKLSKVIQFNAGGNPLAGITAGLLSDTEN